MAIVTASNPGIQIETAAKDSLGVASVLPSPASSGSDSVIVPDAITANNEGNLVATPSYVGRLFVLRPWEYYPGTITVVDGGSGYVVGDQLQMITTPGWRFGPHGGPIFEVVAVDDTGSPQGVVTSLTYVDNNPSRETLYIDSAQFSGDANPMVDGTDTESITSPLGVGVGLQFDVQFLPAWEVRSIIADTSNDLTVHEDWVVAPQSGDNWLVSYILGDVATVTGLTLRAQSGIFEASRAIIVGQVSGTPHTEGRGVLSITGGAALELDNRDGALEVNSNGTLFIGYLVGGEPADGGYVFPIDASAQSWLSFGISQTPGVARRSMYFLYDVQVRAPLDNLPTLNNTEDNTSLRNLFSLFAMEGRAEIRRGKYFNAFAQGSVPPNPNSNSQSKLEGIVRGLTLTQDVAQDGPASILGMFLSSPAGGTATDTSDADLEQTWDYEDVTFVNGGGFGPVATNTNTVGSRTGHGGLVAGSPQFENQPIFRVGKGIKWIGQPTGQWYLRVGEWQRLLIVNPDWPSMDFTNPEAIEWDDDGQSPFDSTPGEIRVAFSVNVLIVDAASEAVSDAIGYVYEGLITDGLPETPLADGVTAVVTGSDGLYAAEQLFQVLSRNDATSPQSTSNIDYGIFSFRAFKYGLTSLLVPFDPVLAEGIDLQLPMLVDDAITKADAASALALSPEPIVTRHDPTNPLANQSPVDLQKMIAFNYDGGNGSVPVIGTVVTSNASPEAVGTVADHIGDGVTGALLLEYWNGVEFGDGDTLTGDAPSPLFTGAVDRGQSPEFYEEYTWLVDAQAQSVNDVYDWLAAKQAENPVDTVFERVLAWGGDDPDGAQLLYSGVDGFFTLRAQQNHESPIQSEGVWVSNRGSGNYDFFTSDSGQVFSVPATVTLSVFVQDITLSPVGLPSIPVRIEVPEFDAAGVRVEPNENLIAQGSTNAQGFFTTSFSYTADVNVDVVVRRSSITSPLSKRYLFRRLPSTITSAGLTATVTMEEDPNADNEN